MEKQCILKKFKTGKDRESSYKKKNNGDRS